jgi:hypothetical protein
MNRCCCKRNCCKEVERPSEECSKTEIKCLEPVLVARVFNQPIIEKVRGNHCMSMRLDHLANVTEEECRERPNCGCGCNG